MKMKKLSLLLMVLVFDKFHITIITSYIGIILCFNIHAYLFYCFHTSDILIMSAFIEAVNDISDVIKFNLSYHNVALL